MAQWLHRVITAVWASGQAPAAWKSARLVPIFKKGDKQQPDNYRGVTLLAAAGKVYVQVLHQRIHGHLNSQLLDGQNGFRPGRGTGDALFCMRRMIELSRDYNTPLHTAFVDFRKAFDSVSRSVLWQLLRARGVGGKLVEMIQDLYNGCQAQVAAGGHLSQPFPMSTGVRQGCPMSPTLFNVFIDFLARLVTQRCQAAGVTGFKLAFRIQGELIPAPAVGDCQRALLLLLYADDLALMADSADGLRTALLVLESAAVEWGMQLNYGKTEVVVFGAAAGNADGQAATHITLNGGRVAHVDHFRYLGSIQEDTAQQERDISARINQAGAAFHHLQTRVFADRGVSLSTKMRLYKAIVVPTLIYGGAQGWAPTHSQRQRLDAFNTTCLRRLLRLRREPEMMSNEQLYDITRQPSITSLLRQHRMRWLGHVSRMQDGTAVKQLLFATAPVGRVVRVQGGPSNTWNRVAQADLTLLGKEGRLWYKESQNREYWNEFVRSICRSNTG